MRNLLRPMTLVATLAAVGVGAFVGASTFALLEDDAAPTVREVTVESSEPAAESSGGLSVGQIYQRAYKGVVEITADGATPGLGGQQQAQGSGWVYDRDGTIVTNQHVVDGADSISVRFWNGESYSAELVGTDPSTDLAVLKVDAPSSLLSPLRIGDSNDVAVGDDVVAIGSPFGLEGTVTSGIVSALHRQMTAPNRFTINDSIQTDAAINHGNSGGPLLAGNGKVIGVNAQIESESGGNDGIGFAIPSNTVRTIVSQLLEDGSVEHAYLGVEIRALSDGVAVVNVVPETPADDAGLQEATGTTTIDGQTVPSGGDVILAIDGQSVSSEAELQSAIDAHKPGETVELTVLRDGDRRSVEVTLAARPARVG
jgi:putative serine protease PepD